MSLDENSFSIFLDTIIKFVDNKLIPREEEVAETNSIPEDIVEEKPPEIGCSFQGRCPRIVGDKCRNETPPWQFGDNGNAIRCHIDIEELKIQQS